MAIEPDDPAHRALAEGDRRSREAVTAPTREPLHLVLWRRHKWKVVGLLFLLLFEMCLLLLGSTIAMGPQ